MADKKATLLIEIKDTASAAIGKLKGALSSLASSALGVTLSIAGLVAGIYSSLSAFSEEESAVNKLNIALKNQGIVSQAVTDDLKNYAAQLQNTTTVGDETSLEMMALLTTFGLTGDKLKEVYSASIDLSKGLGLDLHTAVLMLGKAAAGETGTLSRYGIVIDDNISKSQKLSEVLRLVNDRFGGSAAAEINTYAGKVAQLKKSFGDLLENIGALLVGPASKFVDWLKESTQWLREHTSGLVENTAKHSAHITQLKERIAIANQDIEATKNQIKIAARYDEGAFKTQVLKEQTEQMSALVNARKLLTSELQKATQAEIDLANAGVKKPEQVEDKELTDLLAKADERLAVLNYENEEAALIRDEKLADDLAAKGRYIESANLLEASLAKYDFDTKQKQLGYASQFFGNIATLSRTSNKELATIAKAGAIAQATVDTYAGATKALATIPYPFAIPVAASIIAAGLANVAQISATPIGLAQGGVVMPTAGGTSAIIGEAGSAEAVIPLDDSEAQEKISNALGGVNITIQAGTIVASDYSVTEFAKKIDEELFRLGRNKKSYQG